MRHLKTHKIFESVHDTKEEIEEVVSTCKDILLEAEDTFSSNSLVDKVYKDNEVVITCFYTIPSNIKAKLEEYKSTMIDIHGRLIEYMTSQGFTYNNRGDRYTAYFDMLVGSITYNIAFSKELDKEFIGHLRYLKKYKIFESRFLEFREVISTINDICLEFEDNNCHCKITPENDIHLNIVSLKSRGLIGSIKQPFYLEIDIDMRIIEPKPGNRYLPEWFIETCRRIEDFMSSEGFETLPSVRYDNFETIDELSSYVLGLGFYKVKLEFKSLS